VAVENITLVLNESLARNATMSAPFDYALNTVVPRVKELILAPAEHPDMLWTLAPMIIALVLMQMYFGRNKDEALGWNTAFGNSIALIFISSSLLRQLYIMSGTGRVEDFLMSALLFNEPKFLIIALLFLYGVLLSTISFFHWLPEKLAFFMMSGVPINATAYVVIVLVNSDNILLDRHTLSAGVVILVLVYVLSVLLKTIVPQSVASKINRLEKRKAIVERSEQSAKDKAEKAKLQLRRKYLEWEVKRLNEKAKELSERIGRLRK